MIKFNVDIHASPLCKSMFNYQGKSKATCTTSCEKAEPFF